MSGVKPSNLRERVRKILFEDTWQKYGSEYMSHPYDQDDDEDSSDFKEKIRQKIHNMEPLQ